jgi:hypothetical protein
MNRKSRDRESKQDHMKMMEADDWRVSTSVAGVKMCSACAFSSFSKPSSLQAFDVFVKRILF